MIPKPTMTTAEAKAWRPAIPGGFAGEDWSSELMRFYHALIPLLPPRAWFVEVGVAAGRSLMFAAERFVACGNGGILIGVDPWQGQSHPDPEKRSPLSYAQAMSCFAAHCDPAWWEIVYLWRMQGEQAAAALGSTRLDAVCIDGEHTFPGCAGDIAAFRPLVKPGGFLFGHDYSSRFPGVQRAVAEAFHGEVELWGTIWVARL